MTVEFRARITEECDRQAQALATHHGLKSRAQLIELLIRLEYRRIAYLNTSEGVYSHAASVLSRAKKLAHPLNPNEIERVVFYRGKPISAYTSLSAEPYLIKNEEWQV